MARTVDPVRHAQQRARIAGAAGVVFAERGYDGATTAAIAATAMAMATSSLRLKA